METSYFLTKEDEGKIANIAEKLYQKRLEIGDTVIGWEEFTANYMKFPIPEFGDEINMIKWVNGRSTWIVLLNKELLYRKYPIQLFVSPTSGIYIRINKDAVTEVAKKRIKRSLNALVRSVKMLEEIKNSDTFPRSINILDAGISILRGTINELSIGVNNTPGISNRFRKELKEIVDIKLLTKIEELQLELHQ